MSSVLAAFGVDWRLLLINMINFGVLLLALWYFLYGPITHMLATRREKLAEGVRNAARAEEHLQEIEEARAGMLAEAGKHADDVIARAREAAQEKQRDMVAQSEASAAAIVQEAALQAEELKREAIQSSKQEVARLIVLGMERMAIADKNI